MTYAQLLLIFIVSPTVALGATTLLARFKKRGAAERLRWRTFAPALWLMGIATVYTLPWDNHLIALGVWWYRPTLLLGLSIGHVPLEEALFFPLQTLLVGLWWIWLNSQASQHRCACEKLTINGRYNATGRICVLAVGLALWIGALTLINVGWRSGTYVGWAIVWALPPLLLQILVGGDILWRQRRLVGFIVIPVAFYLSCVDALAIHIGIWTIDPRQSLNLLLGGQLPIEELLFFLLTSALIGFGLVLGHTAETRLRMQTLFARQRSPLRSQMP